MTSILNLERYPEPAPALASAAEPALKSDGALDSERAPAEESPEFEIVLGRRQMASSSLVALVLLSVFSGVSYLIGKSMVPNGMPDATGATAPAASVPVPEAPAVIPAVSAVQTPVEQRGIIPAPIFAAAVPGMVYLQVGVIDKGLAAIWAEGLRSHGLESFAAPGPTDGLGLWRVLIGPLPDPQSYQRAKDVLSMLGLANFGRRYPAQ